MSEPVRLSLVEAQVAPSGFVPAMRTRAAPSTPEAIVADDYARGFADGQQAASAVFATEHAAMAKLLAAAESLKPEASEELAAMIALAVERLVDEIVGSTDIRIDEIAGRAARAVALICDADNARTLWVHPDDLALVEGLDLCLTPMADPALPRGALRLDCSAGWIEDGRSLYLDALRTELGLGDAQ